MPSDPGHGAKLDPASRAKLAIAAQMELPRRAATAIPEVAVPRAIETTPVTPILVHGCAPLDSEAQWSEVELPADAALTR